MPDSMHPSRIPMVAEVIDRQQESEDVFTLRLQLIDPQQRSNYRFQPGQFNMVYLHGVGEVAISIVSDREDTTLLNHTIRAVGRVTRGLEQLQAGQQIGLRGPYGRGWPMQQSKGRDLVMVTGGLGCAPVVAAISAVEQQRVDYGRLAIIEGVRHHQDLIYPERFHHWKQMERTEVVLCCSEDKAAPWPWHTDRVTAHLDEMDIDLPQAVAFLCGPEGMMVAAAETLQQQGLAAESTWLSLERNMQCGDGFCGHCQLGGYFVCKDGPVFRWDEVGAALKVKGL
jgi:sulfhydrogenase subunit gamma (sulfur reductase)